MNTKFSIGNDAVATVEATSPLGLNGEYKLFVRVSTLNGVIVYAQPQVLNISPSEDNKASVLNFDTLSSSVGAKGGNSVVSLSASGTTVIAENNGGISTMASVSFNDSSIYMLEEDGSKVWEITLSYDNDLRFEYIEERTKDIVLVAVGNATMIGTKRLSINSLSSYIYIIRLSLNGDLVDVETTEIAGAPNVGRGPSIYFPQMKQKSTSSCHK
jgi:hypothetical protein